MSRGVTAEHVVRKLFIFLKESLDFELEQDDLIQRDLLDEKEKEDRICKDQCKAFWCERYLKLLIMKKRCTKFIEFFQETSSNRHFISEQILRTQANLKETDLKARVNAQRDQFTLTHELLQKNLYFLYTELEPREIADLMFQSGFISCNDHDSITDSQQKYVRFMSLLGILKEKQLYSQFARTLQTSMKYIPVLERMKEDKILYIKSIVGECVLCIQHNFTLLQKELPDADYTTAVMDHLFDKTNLYDIDHCKGNIRKKSKLLKILLMKGNPACMELLKVIETNLERDNFIKKLKRRSDDINDRGKPDLSPHLKRLSTSCLQEQNEFLLDELEPIDLCDFLLEERAIEIMTHDKITETEERRQQVKDLLQILQKNENDCFHYFLYIIEKNEFNDIRDVLAGPLEALRDEKIGQSDWKLEHKVEKVTDDPKDDTINLRLAVQGRNADRVERDLLQQFKSSASGPLQLTMAYGHMDIENVSCGSVVLQLRPLTDQAVQTLLNARENNKLVDIIFAMLKNIKIADKMDKTEPLEIKVQVCYASPPKENPVYETRNAKQIKHRLGVYKNKLVSDIEPSALASALSKSFPKSKFESVEQAGSCPRRVERLLSLIDEGESDLVYEFVTVLENFGYHEIVKLIDPPDIRWTASMYIL